MSKPVILCIGTNKIMGDSLGPTVGDLLIMEYNINAYVYGHTARPINGVNYTDYLKHINSHHKNNLIIAIDACMGKLDDIGKIKCSLNGIAAGGALKKGYKRVGDIGILGIVAQAKNGDNLSVLKNVNGNLIQQLSRSIANMVYKLVEDISKICIAKQKAI